MSRSAQSLTSFGPVWGGTGLVVNPQQASPVARMSESHSAPSQRLRLLVCWGVRALGQAAAIGLPASDRVPSNSPLNLYMAGDSPKCGSLVPGALVPEHVKAGTGPHALAQTAIVRS